MDWSLLNWTKERPATGPSLSDVFTPATGSSSCGETSGLGQIQMASMPLFVFLLLSRFAFFSIHPSPRE
jgi:hypothetical protein